MSREKLSLSEPRARLAQVLRAAHEVVSIDVVTESLGMDRRRAAKLLSRWREQGWLRRIGQGLYVSVPLDLAASEEVIADPWVLIPTLFGQCYIGGWRASPSSAISEEAVNKTLVLTSRRRLK